MINIYQPSLGDEELQAIKKVFNSNWLGKGPKTEEFIESFAKKLVTENFQGIAFTSPHTDNLLTISSCTEGLFQSIDLYINEGDEVILPSVSFVAAANAIVSKKAKPIFCDVDKRTLNVRLEDIQEKITNKTKAIIVLHYAGVPCDIDKISDFCLSNNIKLIEDNANSPFSSVNSKNTGTFGDIGIWSFDSMKQLVIGDGGMIYCKNKLDAKQLKKLTYLGLESKSGLDNSNNNNNKWWEFNISSPSRRSITNDIQAAMGIEQLKKIDSQLLRRKEIHTKYSLKLGNLNWLDVPLELPQGIISSYYMYHIQLKEKIDRDKLANYMKDRGIYTAFRYYPLHMVEYYKGDYNLPNTEYIASHTLCIPIHQGLKDEDINKIISTIKNYR
jgi:dTDP-4-amino-4,6-dideoxygalactose transaminase